ncbi:MAG: response regulator [Caldilineaceae bacterium]
MNTPQRTILLVDDSREDRFIYRRFLTREPTIAHTVLEADRGDRALAICRGAAPDCILLDYQLPDMNGLELLQALVAAAHPTIFPVVMLTGAGDMALAVEAMKNGAHDYLSKDQATPEQLQRAINNAMEKVALQREVAQQREWFRLTLASIGDGVIATDSAGRITFMNAVAESLTGWSLSAAHQQPLDAVFHLVHDETRQPVESPVSRVLHTGAFVGPTNHTLLVAKDRRETPIENSIAPIRNVGSALLGVVVVFRDVTERRQHDLAVQQWNTSLERQVAQRTDELSRRLQELDTLSRVASHDLRAPLRTIYTLADWITEDAAAVLPATSRIHLSKLQDRIKRMEKLLDDLLAYMQADRHQALAERVDVNRLVDEIGKLVLPDQGFTVSVPAPLPTLTTVRVPLETVLRNLINNAVKHHHRPQGKIQVTAHDLGDMIEFAVTDDGPGIDPQFHARIFQIFQTLQPRDQVEGSGMGLTIVIKIVESCNGRVTVESTLGAGATFRFTWPKTLGAA